MRLPGTLALVAWLAACGDGGGGGAATPAAGPGVDAPAVHLVVDAAAGTSCLLQAEVALAVLELRGGGATGNLLAAPVLVTFAEPSGGVRALTLPSVPPGDYTQLRLALTPGSGRLIQDGVASALDAPADLAIPIAGRLLHGGAPSWLAIGHLGGDGVVRGAGRAAWAPQLVGRLDDSPLTLAGLTPLRVDGVDLLASRMDAPGGSLRLQFAVGCAFYDGAGRSIASRTEFLAAADATDEVVATGALMRAGALYARSARLQPRRTEPLLHGVVIVSDPAQQRVMLRVDAEELFDRLRPIAAPFDVEVGLAGAWLHEPGQSAALPGWPCEAGRRLVVRVATRVVVDGAIRLTADEAAVPPMPGLLPTIEWHARVTAVDEAAGAMAVAALPFVPLVLAGEMVASATVLVDAGATVWRRELQGQGQYAVPLATVQPGLDVIWWRGTPLGAGAVRADLVRVRTE